MVAHREQARHADLMIFAPAAASGVSAKSIGRSADAITISQTPRSCSETESTKAATAKRAGFVQTTIAVSPLEDVRWLNSGTASLACEAIRKVNARRTGVSGAQSGRET